MFCSSKNKVNVFDGLASSAAKETRMDEQTSIHHVQDARVTEPSQWAMSSIRCGLIAGASVFSLLACTAVAVAALVLSLRQSLPTGTILLFSGDLSTLPNPTDHWLICNGSAVSRSDYRELFAVIGTVYGPGNGIDTFNLPDFRARFALGSNGSGSLLAAGGQSSHVLTIEELPEHDHDQGSLEILADGEHTHAYLDPGHNHGGSTGIAPFSAGTYAMNNGGLGNDRGVHSHTIPVGTTGITIQPSGNHTHVLNGTTSTSGQGQSIDMMPPYQIVHYIIRT